VFLSADFTQANADLNTVYSNAQRAPQHDLGTVTPRNIRATQGLWIQYRDAWMRFGMEKYPNVSAASLGAWLTRERIEQLKELTGDR
jgi:uncharacterized protein YecT (DUF1311 family)